MAENPAAEPVHNSHKINKPARHRDIRDVRCPDLVCMARRKATGKKEIPLSPIAIEVVRRIDALFEIERSINGKSAEERLAARRTLSAAVGRRSPGLYARAARPARPRA